MRPRARTPPTVPPAMAATGVSDAAWTGVVVVAEGLDVLDVMVARVVVAVLALVRLEVDSVLPPVA